MYTVIVGLFPLLFIILSPKLTQFEPSNILAFNLLSSLYTVLTLSPTTSISISLFVLFDTSLFPTTSHISRFDVSVNLTSKVISSPAFETFSITIPLFCPLE